MCEVEFCYLRSYVQWVASIEKPNFSFVEHSTLQVIYIAPLKAIVRERMNDWKNGLIAKLGKKMVSIPLVFIPIMYTLIV